MRTDRTFDLESRVKLYERALRELVQRTKLTKAQQEIVDGAGYIPGLEVAAERVKDTPVEIIKEVLDEATDEEDEG